MNRLTRYDEKQKMYIRLSSRLAVDNKLGKLEDLEEQLGCPLDVLMNALNGCIYYMDDDCLECEVNPYLVKDYHGFAFDIFDYGSWFYLSDYKKTWWLKEDKSE